MVSLVSSSVSWYSTCAARTLPRRLLFSMLVLVARLPRTTKAFSASSFRRPGAPRLSSSFITARFASSTSEVLTEDKERLEAWKTDLTPQDLNDLLRTAEEAARAAGGILTANSGCCSHFANANTDDDDDDYSDQQKEQKQTEASEIKYNIKDIVTQYDKEAQTAIEGILRTAYPTHSFLGEEDVAAGAAASEAALLEALQNQRNSKGNDGQQFMWICDPIDGTANFASGLALSAVTLGCCYQGTPVVGVVYDPHANELFAAAKGQGATVTKSDGTVERLRVAEAVTHVKDAIINAGCPADPNAFEASMRGMLALNSRARGLRVIACSALTTAWIAAGRLTAHFGYDLSSWDLVAGALLIQEAGGRVSDLDGSDYRLETRNMLCSNGNVVHEQVLEILREADAVSFTRA